MDSLLLQYNINPNAGLRPNSPSHVTVTYFENPQKFWIRRITYTGTIISILENVQKKCSQNLLRRPGKNTTVKEKMECQMEGVCAYHVQATQSKGSNYGILWKLPEDTQDQLHVVGDKYLKMHRLQRGKMIYARSRYIKNRESNLFECNNRVIILTAYLPDEEYLGLHLLVQFIDEGENHTEWIAITDTCQILHEEQHLLLEKLKDDAYKQHETLISGRSLSPSRILDTCHSTNNAAKEMPNNEVSVDNLNDKKGSEECASVNEIDYIDDNIYCGKLSDFGLQPGGVILARCSEIKDKISFHRGKIVGMNFERTLGLHLQIFFYDYGNTNWVHVLDTRIMPQDLMEIPPMAEEASLYELYPTWIFEADEEPSNHGWSRAACKEFMNMVALSDLPDLTRDSDSHSYVDNDGTEEYYAPYPIYLKIRDTINRKIYVDLYNFPIGRKENRITRGDPICIRDMLLYLGLGCMCDPRRFLPVSLPAIEETNSPVIGSIRGFYEEGSFSIVRISHVESVNEIYVQPINHILTSKRENHIEGTRNTTNMLERLGKELELFYDKIYSSNPYQITDPIIGSLCAVKCYGKPGNRGSQQDVFGKRWYRCIIEDVPQKTRLAQVFLIDVGLRLMAAPGKYLYLLNADRFVNRYKNALCFPIRLENIVSRNASKLIQHIKTRDNLGSALKSNDEYCSGLECNSSCMEHCSLEDTIDALKDYANTAFVMHIAKNCASFSKKGEMKDWEIEEFPSVNLFREVNSWDVYDLQLYDPFFSDSLCGVICINSLLATKKPTIYQSQCNIDTNMKLNTRGCEKLYFDGTERCSHPDISGSLTKWMLGRLRDAEAKKIAQKIAKTKGM